MHFGDTIVIFVLALILFGPKKLPEIGRQIAKLLAEFRRASNEFKMQIDEELRSLEQQERQKQIAAAAAATPVPTPGSPEVSAEEPRIMPPSTGETVSAGSPYAQQYHLEGPQTDAAPDWASADNAADTSPGSTEDTSEARLAGPPPDLAAAAAEDPIPPPDAMVTPAIDLVADATTADSEQPSTAHQATGPQHESTLNGSAPAAAPHEDPVPENAHHHG